MKIPFNKPCIIGKEIHYIKDAINRGKISGDGYYSQKCHQFFQQKYGFPKVLLTNSCTDALEMSALLLDIKPGDEVIKNREIREQMEKENAKPKAPSTTSPTPILVSNENSLLKKED